MTKLIKQRDETFDLMKGTAIIAMILGHCFIPKAVHHFIYIWHMPLFFIVSGYFFKPDITLECVTKIWKGLLRPYIVTAVLAMLVVTTMDIYRNENNITEALYGYMTLHKFNGGGNTTGPIWFLLALAWCRYIYNSLCKLKISLLYIFALIITLSYSALCIGRHFFIPFFLLQGIVSLVFFHTGYMFHKYGHTLLKHKYTVTVFTLTALATGLYNNGMDIWALFFNCYALNIYAAIGMTLLIYLCMKRISESKCRESFFWKEICTIGRYSILVLALHTLEKKFSIINHLMEFADASDYSVWYYRMTGIVLQVAFCIIGMHYIKKIPLGRKLYNL